MEDAKLLRLLHKDPNAGMERLMDQYAALIYAVVKGRLMGYPCVSTDVEDCVAEVFCEFYTALDKYDESISSIKTYLCVLARNNATDLLRRRARQYGEVSLDGELQVADDIDVESEITESELRRELIEAVKALGEPDTSIIIRKYYLGESSRTIADALNMSVSSVDTRTHRALNKLKNLFGGEK